MSEVSKAVDNVRKLAAQFQSLADLIPVLDQIGSIDNATKESEARLEKARLMESNTMTAVLEAENVLEGVQNKVKAAKIEAAAIIEEGHRTKEDIIKRAKEDASRITHDARKKLTGIEADIEQRETILAALNQQIKEREEHFAELTAKIESERARVREALNI